jgi:multicomponent K+:H+ antiporter subunit G
MIETAVHIALGCVSVAILLCGWRLLRGPSAVDRVLALDTLYINVVAAIVLIGIERRSSILFEAALVGAIGMTRFPDFYMRLHAPTKATTLGVGSMLLASMAVSWAAGLAGMHELLITLFLFVTAPVSANLMAKAALHLRLPSKAPPPQSLPYD